MSLPTNKYLWTLLAGAGLVFVVWIWHTGKVISAEEYGYERGLKDERLVWQVRLKEETDAAAAKYRELQERYRALEEKSANDVAAAAAAHRKEIRNVQTKLDKALADARAGMAFRLRWAASCAPTPRDPDRGEAATAGATAGGAGGTAVCELPAATRDDLIREASRADRVVAERNALLEIALKDREVCR